MRKKRNFSRSIISDRVYNNQDISKCINYLMLDGKKRVAEKIMYTSLDQASQQTGQHQVIVFETVMANLCPKLHLATKISGFGSKKQALILNKHRSRMYGIRWLLEAARNRNNHTMIQNLTAELVDAFNHKGAAFKKNQTQNELITKSVVYIPTINQA